MTDLDKKLRRRRIMRLPESAGLMLDLALACHPMKKVAWNQATNLLADWLTDNALDEESYWARHLDLDSSSRLIMTAIDAVFEKGVPTNLFTEPTSYGLNMSWPDGGGWSSWWRRTARD